MDAVKQWKYRPYKLNGDPVAVQTTVSVNFSLAIPDAEQRKEQQISQLYFTQDKHCRDAIAAGHFKEAQKICVVEANLAQQLPDRRGMERVNAYGLAGQAFFYDKKFPEALSRFERELANAQKYLHDDNAEMAYAYRHMAWGLHSNDRVKRHSRTTNARKTLCKPRKPRSDRNS